MILKILIIKSGKQANEIILEANSFVFDSYNLEDKSQILKECSMYCANEEWAIENGIKNPSVYMTRHDDKWYAFTDAYLMNNEGKTIQKFG